MRGTKPHLRIEKEPLADRPPPDWFTADAKAEWERIVPILCERKILTEADLGSLENYCMAQGVVREMEREIQKLGAIQKVYKLDKEGNSFLVSIRKNPAVAIQADAVGRARLLAAELGATPVSRSRPTVSGGDDDDGLFDWAGA